MKPSEIIHMARELGLLETDIKGVFRVNSYDIERLLAVEREKRSEPEIDAAQDAITTGIGIMRGGEQIDPSSIYKSATTAQGDFK